MSNTTVVTEACRALASLSTIYNTAADDDSVLFANADNQQLIAKSHGVEALLKAMNNHSSNAGVVQHVCLALAAIAHDNDNIQFRIATANGIPPLLKALRDHASNAGFAQHACRALATIAASADNAVKIAAAGGIVISIKVMRDHATNAAVVRHACHTLANLARVGDNRPKIAAVRGVESVVKAMLDHPTNAGVVMMATLALKNVSTDQDSIKLKIAAAGGVEALFAALRDHALNPDVVHGVCKVLQSLVSGVQKSEYGAKVATLDSVEALMQAARNHRQRPDITMAVTYALSSIPMHSSKEVAMASLHAARELIMLSDDIPDVAHALHDALQNVESGGAFLMSIVSMQNVNQLLRVLREHASDPSAVHMACSTLMTLCSRRNELQKIVDADGVTILLSAMNTYPCGDAG